MHLESLVKTADKEETLRRWNTEDKGKSESSASDRKRGGMSLGAGKCADKGQQAA